MASGIRPAPRPIGPATTVIACGPMYFSGDGIICMDLTVYFHYAGLQEAHLFICA